MRLRLIAPILAGFTAAFACGGGDEPSGDGDTGDGDSGSAGESGQGDGDGDTASVPDSFCSSDKDCREADAVCDLDRKSCVECIEDADCGSDAICSTGSCETITTCASSKDCPTTQVCSNSLGYCVDCDGNADCDDGEVCHETKCVSSCESDKDCRDSDEICSTDLGICRECVSHTDCDTDQFCTASGVCLEDVCELGEAACVDGSLSVCSVTGGNFETVECPNGCASDGVSCEGDGECETGDEGCECYPNDTCNGSLSCLSNLCVDAGGGTGGNSGTGGGGELPFCERPEAIADFENIAALDGQSFCDGTVDGIPAIGRWDPAFGQATYNTEALETPRSGSTRGMQFTTALDAPASGCGVSANFGAGSYDASGYNGIGFWALGAGQELGIGVHTRGTHDDGFQGLLLNSVDMTKGVTLTGNWAYYEVLFSDLTPTGNVMTVDASEMREIQFIFGPGADVWIDDLVFISK